MSAQKALATPGVDGLKLASLSQNMVSEVNAGLGTPGRHSTEMAGASRSHEMESALYFAKFKGGVSLAVANLSSDYLKEENLNAAVAAADHQCTEMRKELLVQAAREAALVQDALGTRVNEELLNSRLDQEGRRKEEMLHRIKDLEGEMESLKLQCQEKSRREAGCQKQITTLEMSIKDLHSSLEQTNNSERLTSQQSLESNRQCRELERELMDLRIENTRLNDSLEKSSEEEHRINKVMELEKDKLLRDLQQHQIKGISLQQDLDDKTVDKEHLDEDWANHCKKAAELEDEMRMQQVLTEKDRAELEKRLEEEEAANNDMVNELATRTKEMQLLDVEAKGATEARDLLQAQLNDKLKLNLELGKRLHSLQLAYSETEMKLEDKTEAHEKMTKNTETVRSDMKVMQARLQKDQENCRELSKWTRREMSQSEDLDQKCGQLKANDMDHRLRMRQAEADKEVLRDDLDKSKKKALAMREALHQAHSKKDTLVEKVRQTVEDLDALTLRYEKKSATVEAQTRELKELTREFMDKDHKNQLEITTLQGILSEKMDEFGRLDGQTTKSNNQLKDLHDLLQETADKAEKFKEQMMKNIGEVQTSNDALSDELNAQMKRNSLMEHDLLNSERRIKSVQAQMNKNEMTATKLLQINSDETVMLQTQLDRESQKQSKLQLDVSNAKTALHNTQREFEEEVRLKRQMQKMFREEKFEAERMTQTMEDKKEPELENESRIRELMTDRDLNQTRLNEKLESVDLLQKRLNSSLGNRKEYKRELRNAELKEGEYFSTQAIDAKAIQDLTAELKAQEEQHLSDARSVRSKITQLQDALQEKVNTVDHLAKATQAMKAKAKQLQVRLEQTEAEAAQAQTSFEQMLDREQTTAADLRSMIEAKTRDIMTLRSQILNKDEKLQGLTSVLHEKTAQSEALNTETFSRTRQAHQAQMEVETLTIRERDQLDTINEYEEQIVELKLQMRERSHVEKDLQKQLTTIENENLQFRKQVDEKTKAERVLLAELDAKRLHLDEPHANTPGAVAAHAKAEEEFESLLHDMNNRPNNILSGK